MINPIEPAKQQRIQIPIMVTLQSLCPTKVVQVVEFETDDPKMRGEMTITFSLSDTNGRTEIIATHDNLPSGLDPMDIETGWRMSLEKLAKLGESGQKF